MASTSMPVLLMHSTDSLRDHCMSCPTSCATLLAGLQEAAQLRTDMAQDITNCYQLLTHLLYMLVKRKWSNA